MGNKELNNQKPPEGESGMDNMRQELRNLPQLVVPENFEYNLKVRIANHEPSRKAGFIDRLFFPARDSGSGRMIFSTVIVLVCCSVILGYLVIRHFNNMNSPNTNSLDSTYYEGKKVIILPPTASPSSDKTAEQPLHKYIDQKTTPVDQETLKKYIVPSTSVQEEMKTGLSAVKAEIDSSKISSDIKEVGGVKGKKAGKNTTKDSKPVK